MVSLYKENVEGHLYFGSYRKPNLLKSKPPTRQERANISETTLTINQYLTKIYNL